MDLIPRARLTTQFLESNASTHESVFGAIAEIVDNAYDSGSKKLEIDIDKPQNELCGDFYILLRDAGCGMSADDIFNVIAYGWSNKTNNPEMIGMYGNGLKSGSMRVANDCLILTKKNNECSALMISRTFIENPDNKENEVICPCPSWKIVTDSSSGSISKMPMHEYEDEQNKDKANDKAALDKLHQRMERHDMEVDLITKYSPFTTEEDLLAEFDSLDGSSGTCIYLYNLCLNENGVTELSIDHDDTDDIMDVGINEEHPAKSLKRYLCDLYLKPKMEVYLRQSLIRPIRVQDLMHERRKYILPDKKFRSSAKTKVAELKEKRKKLDQKLKKAKGSAAEAKRKIDIQANKENIKDQRQKSMQVEEIQAQIVQLDSELKNKERVTEVKEFAMYLGYNIRDRRACGLRLFNKNRLIVEIDGLQWSKWPLGVLACVDIPASLMQPSMSKQRFADEREFKILQKICLERAQDYAKRVHIEFDKWNKFGYESSYPELLPTGDPDSERALNDALPKVFRCTVCGKFRAIVDFEKLESIDPAFFVCSDNPDPKYNKCDKEEKRLVSKELQMMPIIKNEKPDSDVEEVSVSPDKKKSKMQKGAHLLNSRSGSNTPKHKEREHDPFEDSSEDEMKVTRRLRRKRKSGFGRSNGNEVTSGFDRHRLATSESESGSDQKSDDEQDSRPNKRDNRRESARTAEVENELKRIKREKEELEERNQILMNEMRSCVKHFYPTSWKQSDQYSHSRIENWDHQTITKNAQTWKDSYTKDLKSIVSTCEKKKALRAKIELADSILDGVDNAQNPEDILKKIKRLKQEAQNDLKKMKGAK